MKRNAIILAAGTSSRFIPLSYELPKGLLKVKGEVLVERQIRQLQKAGIMDITLVVGYQAEKFEYLKSKFSVSIVNNSDYWKYNNTSSLMLVLDKLDNTFICSSDNYFQENVFLEECSTAYYSAIYMQGNTSEYCVQFDKDGIIKEVHIGGKNSYVMLGHVYFNSEFSKKFREILKKEYFEEETRTKLWEQVYMKHISKLPMKIKKYQENMIYEFDSLEELRNFEPNFQSDSKIMKNITSFFSCEEKDITDFIAKERAESHFSFFFQYQKDVYLYFQEEKKFYIEKMKSV